MSEPWIGPPDGALRWEREGHSDRSSGVLEPSEAATAGPGEGAMYGPTADPPEPDKAPEEPLEEGPALAGVEPAGPDTGSGNFEERLRRLEDALAHLQDLKGMETRVAVECLLTRLTNFRLQDDGDPHITGQPFRSPNRLPITFDVV